MTTLPGRPRASQILRDPLLFLAFGFGAGLSPRAPGTAGSLVALALFPLLAQLPIFYYLLFLAFATLAGIPLCGSAAKKLGVKDHGGIVWDEMVGLWLALSCMPLSIPWLLAGFLLFRLFDIVKPWPISWVDRRVEGGLGVMADDLLAGLFSWLLLMGAKLLLI